MLSVLKILVRGERMLKVWSVLLVECSEKKQGKRDPSNFWDNALKGVEIQRGNAASVMGKIPSSRALDDIFSVL